LFLYTSELLTAFISFLEIHLKISTRKFLYVFKTFLKTDVLGVFC